MTRSTALSAGGCDRLHHLSLIEMSKHWRFSYNEDDLGLVLPALSVVWADITTAFVGYGPDWNVVVVVEFTSERSKENVKSWFDVPPIVAAEDLTSEAFIDCIRKWKHVRVIIGDEESLKHIVNTWK